MEFYVTAWQQLNYVIPLELYDFQLIGLNSDTLIYICMYVDVNCNELEIYVTKIYVNELI